MMGFPDRTTEIVQDVLSYFAENSKYTLADSKHAPKNARQMLAAKGPSVRAVLSSFCTHMDSWGCSSEEHNLQPHDSVGAHRRRKLTLSTEVSGRVASRRWEQDSPP